MLDEHEWRHRRAQELKGLGDLIALTGAVFPASGVGIEGSRHYGLGLLAHGVEIARAIRRCTRQELPGPAFALARALNEAILRGHIIVHEIDLEELNELLERTGEWLQGNTTQEPPPKIAVRGNCWKPVPPPTRGNASWRTLECEHATRWQESVVDMRVLHDLVHGGMSQALQMVDEDRTIGAHHSTENQTRLLYFSEQAVLFSIMTWPGALQRYASEINERAERTLQRVASWDTNTQRPSR